MEERYTITVLLKRHHLCLHIVRMMGRRKYSVILSLIKTYTCYVNKEVGDTIRELRKEKHLSQEKLADAIDSHQVYISEIEKGIKLPSLTVINSIAKAFGLSLTHFISLVEQKLEKNDTQENN